MGTADAQGLIRFLNLGVKCRASFLIGSSHTPSRGTWPRRAWPIPPKVFGSQGATKSRSLCETPCSPPAFAASNTVRVLTQCRRALLSGGRKKTAEAVFFNLVPRSVRRAHVVEGLGHAARDPGIRGIECLSSPHAMPQGIAFRADEKNRRSGFFQSGARKRTRTSTPLPAPGPEPGASTNSAIRAMVAKATLQAGASRKMRPNHSEFRSVCPP